MADKSKPPKYPDQLTTQLFHRQDLNHDNVSRKEQHNMAQNKPVYNFYGFLKNKKPHEYSREETDLVLSEVENMGHRIDAGIFRDNPHLMGMLGQRLQEEAARRMGISTDPAHNQDSPDGGNGNSVDSTAPKAPWKPGLFRD